MMRTLIGLSLFIAASALKVKPEPAAKYCPNLSSKYSDVRVRPEGNYSAIGGKKFFKSAEGSKMKQAFANWAASACPWEESRHSGFFVGDKQAHAAEEFANNFGCLGQDGEHLASVSTDDVLRQLSNTRFIFAGDSVSRQFSQAMMCQLRDHFVKDGFKWAQWPVYANAEQCLPVAGKGEKTTYQHCKMESGCSTFQHGVEVCFADHPGCAATKLGDSVKDFLNKDKTARNVIVVGTGHHGHCKPEQWTAFHKTPPKFPANTKVVFNDFVPQHFSENADGHFPLTGQSNNDCLATVEVSEDRKVELDKAITAVESAGWSRLETYNLNAGNGKFHASLAGVPGKGKDCTHWLMPGMPDVWTKMLIQQMYDSK